MNHTIAEEKFTVNTLLQVLLQKATGTERLQLTRILQNDRDKEPYLYNEALDAATLCLEITSAGGNSFANALRQQGNSYGDILDDVAKVLLKKEKFNRYSIVETYDEKKLFKARVRKNAKLLYIKNNNIDFSHHENQGLARSNYLIELDDTPELFEKYLVPSERAFHNKLTQHCLEIEERIIYQLLEKSYSKMSAEEKLKFDQAIQDIALEKGLTNKKLARGVAGLIALGEIGGFTTYMLMSIFLSKIGFGVFGFSVFTGASTLLGVILGPVGWAATASWLLWGFASPSKTKMAKIVATIALIRLRVLEDEQAEVERRIREERWIQEEKDLVKKILHRYKYPLQSARLSYLDLTKKKTKKGRKKV